MKFNLDWRDEYRLIGGRADTVYGGLVIEYEPPCSLRQTNKTGANAHAIQQVKDYISGLQKHEHHNIERYAGAVCDGNFFVFLRYKEGHWHTEPPVPVTPYSCARFLRYLFALQTELATTPENLLRDFGESSSSAHACVRAFYDSLATSTAPKVGTLYRQWAQTFSEVCGYEENSPRLDVDALAKTYNVSPSSGEKKINPFKLFFAIHSYYATFIKLLAVQILYFYARQKVAHIPKFDAKNKQHVQLAENSVACHAAAPSASETELAKLEKAVNETAAAIWDISDVELRDIESSLADLQ